MARILVVEDEAPLRRIIALNLVRRGHTVIEAESVATAQEALAAFAFQLDLILLDLNLPDQTGWDILRALKQPINQRRQGAIPSRLPAIIVITAGRPARSRVEEFHPAAVLLKPFPIEALLRLIQRVLTAEPAEVAENDGEEERAPPEATTAQESLPRE